jgi:hypothetical protein
VIYFRLISQFNLLTENDEEPWLPAAWRLSSARKVIEFKRIASIGNLLSHRPDKFAILGCALAFEYRLRRK